ncbi:MAG: IS1634 family transposase [Candidatus Eisenbacteria sp.]|nr:IS1634 family transposase [Candidatus Eisenbacteria bacterium]
MASLTKKKVRGHTYWYARECAWVDGKPKIVWQKYLGKADAIVEAMTGKPKVPEPKKTVLAEFGAVAACFDMSQRLKLREIVDRHASKRDQGLSVGTYMELAAINRAVAPTSKRAFGEWFETTALRRLIPAEKQMLTSQRFWDHMGFLNKERIRAIETDLTAHLVKEFKLDLRRLVYDATNFYTYINTRTKSELAQRGNNKQKRNDLRQVSLALMVTEEFHIPLFHALYGGNINDPTSFGSVVDELIERHRAIAGQCERVTLVFDKGNNSDENIQRLDASQLHFVGSLVPSHHPDLLKVPRSKYAPLKGSRFEDVSAYRTSKTVFGQKRTIVVTFNENLFDAQVRGLGWQLQKKRRELRALKYRLARRASGKVTRGRKPTLASVQRQVDRILSWQYHSELFDVDVRERRGHVTLSFNTNTAAVARLHRRQFGKTILFTDNNRWGNERIVAAYRGQYRVEDAFKQMKHPVFVSWKPRFHWTDEKIRVHAFYCVLALTITSLLQRELSRKGFEISIPKMMENLVSITEVATFYPKNQVAGDPVCLTLGEMNRLQKTLYRSLGLKKYRAM